MALSMAGTVIIRHQNNADLVAEDMALRELEAYLGQVLDSMAEAGAKHPRKKKHVHELRVGCRRGQAALSLYADFLPRKRKKRVEKRLKALRDAARDPRDLDVLIGLLAADKTGPDSGALLEIAKKERDKAQKKLRRAVARTEDRGFRRDVKKLLKDAANRRTGNGMRFGPWARVELRPVVREFFAAAPTLSSRAKIEALHEFRIQAKYLRYTMEMLEPAFPAMFKKDLLPRVEALQDRLGDIIDITERKELFAKWRKRTKNKSKAHYLREHIALERSRLEQARGDFAAWCTPEFLRQLKAGFDALLAQLVLVAPAQVKEA